MTSDPKRLTVVGATDLERSLLQAARRERPSHDLTARMAAGLGISAAAVTAAAAAPAAAAAAPVAAAKTTLAAWVSAGVLAGAVAAGVVGVRLSSAPAPVGQNKPAAAVVAAPVEDTPAVAASTGAPTERRSEKIRRRSAAPAAVPAPAADLRDQIALVDAARSAVKAGSTERALVLLRRYEVSYPGGAFRPEVLALRIQALDEAGHAAEARALAREFLARHPHSPLADRVGRVAQK